MLADADIERILVVTAHPDDVDFGAAGTVASWTDAGIEVAYCIVTDGDAGGFDPDVPREDIPGVRRAEQRAAAAAVGVTDVTFLGYPDGRLTASFDLRRDLARVIREQRPQRVLQMSPERNWDRVASSHPDHLAAGEAAMCAVYPDARNEFAHPQLLDEGLAPHVVEEVWMMAFPQPDHVVDITDTLDRKVEAVQRHTSQVVDRAATEDMVRRWTSENARRMGLPEGRYAEIFKVVATA